MTTHEKCAAAIDAELTRRQPQAGPFGEFICTRFLAFSPAVEAEIEITYWVDNLGLGVTCVDALSLRVGLERLDMDGLQWLATAIADEILGTHFEQVERWAAGDHERRGV